MLNLGPKSAAMLAQAGYHSPEHIRRDGAALTFARLQIAAGGRVSRVMLWALQGALMELHWQLVPDEIRTQLLDDVATHTAALADDGDRPAARQPRRT